MIRVLVVDDSATMRAIISQTLSRDPEIEVVGQAAGPLQARNDIKTLNPDVVTLDIEMPQMNGLEFLERIMRLRPMPVVMVSSLTSRGAEASLRALELGAFDCVAKPNPSNSDGLETLTKVVRAAALSRPRVHSAVQAPAAADAAFQPNGRIVAIGASTGGVEALLAIVSGLPGNCAPTVITQHMPATFTSSFARRLDRACAATVTEAVDGAPMIAGRIYLAPGGETHLELTGPVTGPWRCRLRPDTLISGHRPSVDALFNSVAAVAGLRSVGVILTGMGRDGAAGMLAMRRAGAQTVGQDEASCIVYGMPKAAVELGAVERQVSLASIAGEIIAATRVTGATRRVDRRGSRDGDAG